MAWSILSASHWVTGKSPLNSYLGIYSFIMLSKQLIPLFMVRARRGVSQPMASWVSHLHSMERCDNLIILIRFGSARFAWLLRNLSRSLYIVISECIEIMPACQTKNDPAYFVPFQKSANLFEIKACEKFNRRHMFDIPRIKFFAQHRDRTNWSFLDGRCSNFSFEMVYHGPCQIFPFLACTARHGLLELRHPSSMHLN